MKTNSHKNGKKQEFKMSEKMQVILDRLIESCKDRTTKNPLAEDANSFFKKYGIQEPITESDDYTKALETAFD